MSAYIIPCDELSSASDHFHTVSDGHLVEWKIHALSHTSRFILPIAHTFRGRYSLEKLYFGNDIVYKY